MKHLATWLVPLTALLTISLFPLDASAQASRHPVQLTPKRAHIRASYDDGRLRASFGLRDHGVRIGIRRGDRRREADHRSGHWQIVQRRVWTPGYYQGVQVPARYETRYDACGRPYQVLIEAGCTRQEWVPGCWKWVQDRVWVEDPWRRD